MVVMCDCTLHAISPASSALSTLGVILRLTRASLASDDVVEAAWNNGLGVHALIWVS